MTHLLYLTFSSCSPFSYSWTLITATFSHSTAGHILLNCFSFYTFAPNVIYLIGNSAFMGLYFLGGIVCSLTSLTFNPGVRYREVGSHGASGEQEFVSLKLGAAAEKHYLPAKVRYSPCPRSSPAASQRPSSSYSS